MSASPEHFLQRLIDSGLMSAAEVQPLRENLPAELQRGDDAQHLARELVRRQALTRYQAAALYHEKRPVLVLGNYVILEKLGQGGMGVVLKAEHRRMKRIVALKVLSPHVISNPGVVQRFHREVEAAARLDHPNIVAALDADEARGTHFLVMQYVEGSDLASVVKQRGPIPVELAVNYVLDAAQGLEYAHAQGITHRDVKPANLLLDKQGVVRILDMGLARIEDSAAGSGQADLTNTGAVMGTVDYMSPEQALDTKHADARSDIYSLGCTLHFLLTGRAVYDGDTLLKKILAHREQAVPPLTLAGQPVPGELNAIFQKMIAKNPADRQASMSEVIRELKDWQSGVPRSSVTAARRTEPAAASAELQPASALQQLAQFVELDAETEAAEGPSTAAGETFAHSRADHTTMASISHRSALSGSGKHASRMALAAAAVFALVGLGLCAWWYSSSASAPNRELTESPAENPATPSSRPPRSPTKRARSAASTSPEAAEGDRDAKPEKPVEPKPAAVTASSPLDWPGSKPRPSPSEEPLAGRSNLLSLIDAERDSVVGMWKLDDSGLAFDRAEGASSLQIPVDVPEEYRLNLELERLEGTEAFVVGLPIGGVMTIVVLDGASGRTYGLNALDGKPFENNELTGQGPVLPEGNLHKLTCVVRKRELVVECDGRRLIGWSGDPVRLAASFTTWIVPRTDRAFIGGWQTGFRIRRLELAPADDSASASAVQLVVGSGPGELSDLKGAFELARPGDTILIRHRGPLDFSATDLTGKTPLAIVGDRSADGIDFWPILRQAPRPVHPGRAASPETDAAGLFHAENLQLTLRRVHLAVGGPNRPPLQAVFSLGGGRIELDECTVTAGIAAEEKGSAETTFPLVRAGGQALELALSRSFVRGNRLETCLAVRGSPAVNIFADNFLWAGGPAPWLSARELTGRLNVTLDRSTLYNLSSFVDWQPSGLSVDVPPAPANVAARNSLFVGSYANSAPLLAWNAANKQPDLPRAVAEKRVVFQGTDNVFHRFAGYYVDPKKNERADLAKWRSLWGRSATTDAREGDPQFRVWPADALLEECTPRDLFPRFSRQKQRAREFDFPLGANPADLPPALARLFDRPAPLAGDLSAANLAASPRGVPRVLIVHQKNGPHKTLEGAFAEAQNDDIIEIADDATYAPRRNFSVAQAKAVLSSPAENLTVRAAEGRHPVIVLRDELQQGKLPVFHPDGAPRDMGLFLLEGNGASLQLDGLHFRVALTKGSPHGIVFAPVTYLRVTNCSGIDFSGAPAVLVNAYDPVRFLYHAGVAGWFENLLLHAPSTFDGTIRPAGATETLIRLESRNAAGEYQIRNCVFSGGGIALKVQAWETNFTRNLSIGHSTFVGQVAYLTSPKDLAVNCQDNLVLCVANPFLAEPPLPPAGLANRGAHNALWLTSRPLTADERNADANALLPGPLLRLAPVPEGASTPKDPLKRYRLKRGQPAATLATDGGPAGVRTDFFPELPALPSEFFQ